MNTKTISTILTLALTIGLCQTAAPIEAATPQLSTKKFTIEVGKTATLKLKKTSKKAKKAKWTVASGKKVIRLSEKKKASVKVKALKEGMAKISCKVGAKKLTCRVVVKKETIPQVTEPSATVMPVITPSATPISTCTPTATPKIEKNSNDVALLQQLIASQHAVGATVSSDLDSGQYGWSDEGRLIKISWDNLQVRGEISLVKFTELQTFSCQNNEVTGLDFGGNRALKMVNCTNNQIWNLNVNACYGLEHLYCKGNRFLSLDVAGLVYLLDLECDDDVKVWRAPE